MDSVQANPTIRRAGSARRPGPGKAANARRPMSSGERRRPMSGGVDHRRPASARLPTTKRPGAKSKQDGMNFSKNPRKLALRFKVKGMAFGRNHVVACSIDGNVWCWGNGMYGQLGHGQAAALIIPRLVMQGKHIVAVSAGRYHNTAVTRLGAIYTWGAGENGQNGHNETKNVLIPRLVDSIFPCVVGSAACGEYSTCIIASKKFGCGPDAKSLRAFEQHEFRFKTLIVRRDGQTGHGLGKKDLEAIEQAKKGSMAKLRVIIKMRTPDKDQNEIYRRRIYRRHPDSVREQSPDDDDEADTPEGEDSEDNLQLPKTLSSANDIEEMIRLLQSSDKGISTGASDR